MWSVLLFIAIIIGFVPLEVTVRTTWLGKKNKAKTKNEVTGGDQEEWKASFGDWAKEFRIQEGVALFGILVLGESDIEAGKIINDENFRKDIARYSDKDCWFIYFIQSTQNKNEEQNHLSPHHQHAEGVNSIKDELNLNIKEIPYFIFFERPEEHRYVYLPLNGLSKEEIMQEVKSMFEVVRTERGKTNYSPFKAIQKYKNTKTVGNVTSNIWKKIEEIGIVVIISQINSGGM